MTWTPEGRIPIIYRPQDIEQMEIQLELLKRLEDNPENFLPLFHPRFAHWSWWSTILLEKIGKLVKREAVKEMGKVERTLQYAKEQQHSQDPTILHWRKVEDDILSAKEQVGGQSDERN
jgi:Mlc titration factor MtfA (ptsG expression regulator)